MYFESENEKNKAEYPASDAPSSHLREGVTDGRTDTPSYRDATAHLKRVTTLAQCTAQ